MLAKFRTLGHDPAINQSGYLEEWLLTSSEGRPKYDGKTLDTWTRSCYQPQQISGGMAADVINK
jgi:hypothetical protein